MKTTEAEPERLTTTQTPPPQKKTHLFYIKAAHNPADYLDN